MTATVAGSHTDENGRDNLSGFFLLLQLFEGQHLKRLPRRASAERLLYLDLGNGEILRRLPAVLHCDDEADTLARRNIATCAA